MANNRINKHEQPVTISLTANTINDTAVNQLQLSKNYKYLKAIRFEFGSSAVADDVYQDVLPNGISLDGIQIYPPNTDVKIFVSGTNIPPCERWCQVWEEIQCEGSNLTIPVQNTATVPTNHDIKLYLWLTNEEPPSDWCGC